MERLQKRIAFLEKNSRGISEVYKSKRERKIILLFTGFQVEVDLKSEEIVNAENIQGS